MKFRMGLTLVILAAVGLSAWTAARGSATAADARPPASDQSAALPLQSLQTSGTMVFECFDINKGTDPQAQVFLLTKNFGTDEAIVRTAFQMCEPALKRRPPGGGGGGETDIFPHVEATVQFADPTGAMHAVMLVGTGAWHVMVGPNGEADPNLGGPDTVPVELLALSLQSAQPVQAMGSFFDIFVEIQGAGRLTEIIPGGNLMPGILEVPPFTRTGMASAMLDISIDVMIVPRAEHLLSPLPMDIMVMAEAQLAGVLTHKPPSATDSLTLVEPVPLEDSNGNPAGRLAGVSLLLNAGGATTGATRVLECYKLDKGADPDDSIFLTTGNFGRDDVAVRRSSQMCEGAIKAGQPSTAAPPNVVWQCYDLRDGLDPNAPFTLTTQNFGEHRAEVRRAVLMCEEARKLRVNAAGVVTVVGQPTGRTYECFVINGKIDANEFFLTTRNFGPDDVVVRNPRMMCEPAKKVHMASIATPVPPTRTPTPATAPTRTPTPATAPTATPTPAGIPTATPTPAGGG